METSECSDSDVIFLKEEFKVVYRGPFPVPKNHGDKYCKCKQEDKPHNTAADTTPR